MGYCLARGSVSLPVLCIKGAHGDIFAAMHQGEQGGVLGEKNTDPQ